MEDGVYIDRLANESILNTALNGLKGRPYPSLPPNNKDETVGITCSGPITPACVFFAGDLTQYGGNYNLDEQADPAKDPSTFVGGGQLQHHRNLFDPENSAKEITQLDKCGPLYFGLGNHGKVSFSSEIVREVIDFLNLSIMY